MPPSRPKPHSGRCLGIRLGFSLSLRGLCAIGAPAAALSLAACGEQAQNEEISIQEEMDRAEPFIAVTRPAARAEVGVRRQALETTGANDEVGVGQDFYLAIRKSELGKPWFLSAFLKQFYPGAVRAGAAQSLGTRVVAFRAQNGRLYVFDVDGRKQSSDHFNPQVAVEAYPIVQDYTPFHKLPGASAYVLIDPSGGLNQFGVLSDAYAQGEEPEHFGVELSYLQRFRRIADGVTYEQVFTGYGEVGSTGAAGQGEPHPFRASGVLGIGLRRYQEGAGFTPTLFVNRNDPPGMERPIPEYYFRSEATIIPNTGETEEYAVHWNVPKDKTKVKPIEWVVSANVDKVQSLKRVVKNAMTGAFEEVQPYKDYDVYGAIAKGVTNWNEAFFDANTPVLKVRKGTAADSPGDDDTNFLYVDEDPSFGAAFANWRNNPNTGEIRGTSVYFNTLWLQWASQAMTADPMMVSREDIKDKAKFVQKVRELRAALRPQKTPKLVWRPMRGQELCTMWARPLRDLFRRPRPGEAQLTKKEKVERYVTHVVLHEIGHTLGLRHNFKGSLKWGPASTDVKSSSVMEYVDDYDAVYVDKPGSHDIAAIKYLYQLSNELPKDPFCTDDNISADPNCTPYDQTDNPLEKYYGADYTTLSKAWLEKDDFGALLSLIFGGYITSLSDYVRAPATTTTAAVRARAWNLLITDAVAPTPPAKLAINPFYAENADFLAYFIFLDLFDTPLQDLRYPSYPTDTALLPQMVEQAKQNLLNRDKGRAYDTRRLMIRALKIMQRDDAMQALRDARTEIAAGLGGLPAAERGEAEELLRRIDKALSPYYG
jgi:hypothetical protein